MGPSLKLRVKFPWSHEHGDYLPSYPEPQESGLCPSEEGLAVRSNTVQRGHGSVGFSGESCGENGEGFSLGQSYQGVTIWCRCVASSPLSPGE